MTLEVTTSDLNLIKLTVLNFQLCVLCQTKLFLNSKTSIHMQLTFLVSHNPSLNLTTSPQSTQSLLNMSLNLSLSNKPSPSSHADSRSVTLSLMSPPLFKSCNPLSHHTSSIQVWQPLITSHLLYSSLATSDHITPPLFKSGNL